MIKYSLRDAFELTGSRQKEWCLQGMKGFLRKQFVMLITVGMLCTYTAEACGAELRRFDFSDRNYLLPVDFAIQDQRAVEANYTDTGYQDSTIQITIGSGRFEDRCDYWTADIRIKDPSQMRTSAAKGDFKSKGTRDGVELCGILNAVLGLNGDFVNGTEKLDFGYVVRQGVLFRDNLDTAGRWNSHLMDVLAIDEDGDFHIVRRAKAGDIADMMVEGKRIMNSFCFGPALVIDGVMVEDFDGADTWMNMAREYERQRIAFCQVESLHYKVVCCSGPYTNTSTLMKSTGLTLADFTRLVAEQGVTTAYNLDGGDSSLLYFHGKRINEKPNQSIRKLQDVIYFVSAEGL